MPRPNTGPRLKWLEKRRSYYIVWFEAGRERLRSTGTDDRREAEARLAEFIGESAVRHAGPRDPGQFPIADALDLYGSLRAPNAADPARIAYAIDALLPFWGESMVAHVTERTCRAYERERGRKPATVRRELATLKAAINFARDEGKLTTTVPVWLPDKPDGRDRWLTRSEAARLLNAARNARSDVRLYLPLFIVLGLYTGARKEALLSLRWSQVDLERGRINFAKPNERKTNKRRAHIPIPARLMTFLRLAWRRRASDIGFVIHDKGKPIKDIGDGKSGSFGTAVKRAGLEGVTPHVLRHTCGTWLAQSGVDLQKIGWWLGQSNNATVELYSHHHPDFQEDARKALDRRKG